MSVTTDKQIQIDYYNRDNFTISSVSNINRINYGVTNRYKSDFSYHRIDMFSCQKIYTLEMIITLILIEI